MSNFGKSGSTNTVIPTLSPEQNAMIAAQTGLFTSQIAPAYARAVQGATDLYNQSLEIRLYTLQRWLRNFFVGFDHKVFPEIGISVVKFLSPSILVLLSILINFNNVFLLK